jgi:hypothetical protein
MEDEDDSCHHCSFNHSTLERMRSEDLVLSWLLNYRFVLDAFLLRSSRLIHILSISFTYILSLMMKTNTLIQSHVETEFITSFKP